MRSSFRSLRRQRVVGNTAGSFDAAEGPRLFFLPMRVGRGGSHFFFCGCWSLGLSFSWFGGASPGFKDGMLP